MNSKKGELRKKPCLKGPRSAERVGAPPSHSALSSQDIQIPRPAPSSAIFMEHVQDGTNKSHWEPTEKHIRGTVVSWVRSPTYGYHGYIRCDEQAGIPGFVLVNSASLRNPGSMFHPGDQVEFKPVRVTRGHLATDVAPQSSATVPDEGVTPQDADNYLLGVVRHVNQQRLFGMLQWLN
jgi:hypothetical protein